MRYARHDSAPAERARGGYGWSSISGPPLQRAGAGLCPSPRADSALCARLRQSITSSRPRTPPHVLGERSPARPPSASSAQPSLCTSLAAPAEAAATSCCRRRPSRVAVPGSVACPAGTDAGCPPASDWSWRRCWSCPSRCCRRPPLRPAGPLEPSPAGTST